MAEGVQNDLCPGRIRKQQRRPRGVQPWRIAACRGCHAVQEIGGVSKPWLLSLFQDFGGPEVSLKFGSLDFSWISLPIVHVDDELIWSADFGSMQLILVFLASSLQCPSLDPTPSIFYCRDHVIVWAKPLYFYCISLEKGSTSTAGYASFRTQAKSNSALTTVLTREQTDKRDPSSEAIWERVS